MAKCVVEVWRISYFERTKRKYDIMILMKRDLPFTAHDYHERLKAAGIKAPQHGHCGCGFALKGGGGKEWNIDTYREI